MNLLVFSLNRKLKSPSEFEQVSLLFPLVQIYKLLYQTKLRIKNGLLQRIILFSSPSKARRATPSMKGVTRTEAKEGTRGTIKE